jgi:hypothetical protein
MVLFLENYPEHDYDLDSWMCYRKGGTIEHGWLELNGKIIDPAWHEFSLRYFSCWRFTKEQAFLLWAEHDHRLPLRPDIFAFERVRSEAHTIAGTEGRANARTQ